MIITSPFYLFCHKIKYFDYWQTQSAVVVVSLAADPAKYPEQCMYISNLTQIIQIVYPC